MVVMKGARDRNLYYLKGSTVTCVMAASVDSDDDVIKLWRMRLGQKREKSMQTLVKQDLLKGTKTSKLKFCEHCVLSKKIKVSFGTAIHSTKRILDYVHTDVWGPTKMHLLEENTIVSFVDDYFRRNWVYTISHKSEVHVSLWNGEGE